MANTRTQGQVSILAIGYVASLLAGSGMMGSYRPFSHSPTVERILVFFLLPLSATAIRRVLSSLRPAVSESPDGGPDNAALDGIVLALMAFLVSVHLILIAVLVGAISAHVWAQRTTVVLLGVTMIWIGNLLPRTRPNMAFGIRTSRTLSDRQLWMVTHRASGYALVLLGIATTYAGLFRNRPEILGVPFTGLMIAGLWLCAFYWRTIRLSGGRHA